jgi:DMSO/TMAO reductase YedYZ molybdopterin-dependent catalytic subunit
MRWRGGRFSTIRALAGLSVDATHLTAHGADGYTTNVSLDEALKGDVLLVHSVEDESLPGVHGGPVRLLTPQLYAWTGVKWITRLELMCGARPGFWEQRGYSMSAYPWRNDRYSS